jgi:hypothetical protein
MRSLQLQKLCEIFGSDEGNYEDYALVEIAAT